MNARTLMEYYCVGREIARKNNSMQLIGDWLIKKVGQAATLQIIEKSKY